MKKAIPDLNEKILGLKRKEKSLRQIAAAVSLSHTTVMRRLREMEQVSLPGIVTDKAGCNTLSKPHQSRICGESEDTANQVSHKKHPSRMSDDDVTPLTEAHKPPYKGQKEGNSPRPDDLASDLIRFLESKGFEVYRMHVEQETYQVKHNGQTIRFYVQREQPGE